MPFVKIPRILFAAPYSSGGKTTFACGFMRALTQRGLGVAAFKCGPDYVDAAYHKATLGAPTRNIDLFFSRGDALIRAMMAEDAAHADVAVIEGVMGYYDGAGGTTTDSSTYDMAGRLGAPVVLVVHARGITQTLSAIITGINRFRSPSHIAGVVLNFCRPTLYKKAAPLIERECGLPVLGYLPGDDSYAFPMRGLGLHMPHEIADFDARMNRLAAQMEKTLDIDALLALARSAPPLEADPLLAVAPLKGGRAHIAVARDEAFSFYYDENLELLRRCGADILPFSPLHDTRLPPQATGLYLGGGYIEVYAAALSANTAMRTAVADACRSGMPVIAEGSGLLYMQAELEDEQGTPHPMAGVLPGRAHRGDKRARFGYITLAGGDNSLLCHKGEQLTAHEFHEWDTDNPGEDLSATKPVGGRSWLAGHVGENHYFGFPQPYYYANPATLQRFVQKAAAHRDAHTK